VISDRYFDSSLAYQGAARGLGVDAVLELNLSVVGGLEPDVTFLLLLPPEEAQRRAGSDLDRIERERAAFRGAVDEGYRGLAERFPRRIVALDGTQPADAIAEAVRERLGVHVG
jgi:dTMP kinase